MRVCCRGMLCLRQRLGLVSLFTNIHFSHTLITEEGHYKQPEHGKLSQKRDNDSHQPKRRVVKKGLPKDFVFTEEAAQGREAGNGESGNRHHPERYWNHFAQAAHATHVLLAT